MAAVRNAAKNTGGGGHRYLFDPALRFCSSRASQRLVLNHLSLNDTAPNTGKNGYGAGSAVPRRWEEASSPSAAFGGVGEGGADALERWGWLKDWVSSLKAGEPLEEI